MLKGRIYLDGWFVIVINNKTPSSDITGVGGKNTQTKQ